MSSPYSRDIRLLARINARWKERLHELAEQRDGTIAARACSGQGTKSMAPFLREVFGDAVGGERHVVVFTLPGARSEGFTDVAWAERYATKMADRHDVYIGAGLYRHPRRGSAKDVSTWR